MTPMTSLYAVSKTYSNTTDTITALHNVSLDIYPGDFISISGSSGSGKTTLLNILSGMIQPTTGSVIYNSHIDINQMSDRKRTAFRRRNIGFIYQDYNLLQNMTARENIMFPLILDNHHPTVETWAALRSLAADLGIFHTLHRYPSEMSGGEQQRAAIARAVLPSIVDSSRQTIIIADEPSGNLDEENSEELATILKNFNQSIKQTIVLATHDTALAKKATTHLKLYNGTLQLLPAIS